MAKYKVRINRVEYFTHEVVVEADSPTSAVKK